MLTDWSPHAVFKTHVRKCRLQSPEEINQCQQSYKPNHCPGGHAPTGFLDGIFHIGST